jgi:arylsulfatase A-like enzyme
VRSLVRPSSLIPVAATLAASLAALAPRPARADHPVFDLVANRPLAHVMRQGGLAIAAGSPAMARYVHFSRPTPSWRLGAIEDGRKVALATTQAVLEVPLTQEQAQKGGLVLFGKGVARQTVRASVGGKAAAAVAMPEAFGPVSVPLPEGALAAGENRITLVFAQSGKLGGQKASAAIETILIGAGAATDVGPPPVAGDKRGLSVFAGGGLVYYVFVPEGGALVGAGDAGGCTLTARAVARGGKQAGGEWKLGTPLDLSPLAREIVRLELGAGGGACKGATLSSAALTKKGEAPTVARPQRPKNVVFWMSDSTRADKFKVFNPKTRVETAVMDEMAKKATLFATAYVQGNESRVSHASHWTGVYPSVHKFIPAGAVLAPTWQTFAKIAKAAGLYTAGYMGNGYIRDRWGFAGGFDFLRNHITEGGGLKAEDFVKVASEFLTKRDTSPFFLYLGTIDAHVSWRAHSPWIEKYDPGYTGPFVKSLSDPDLDKVVAGKIKLSDRDKVRVRALYDSDISYNDQQFGELLKILEKRGKAADTMIILSADHGDEFWEHGKIGHGQSLREELVHTPLLVYYPPLFPAGVVEEGVETIDLLPTIADALGQKIPEAAQGESLIPLAQGVGRGYPRAATSSQYELAHAMRLGRYKLWIGGTGDTRFSDVVADPMEDKDLSKERPIERRFVNDAMGLWMAYQSKWKKAKWGVASNLRPAFAESFE